ncbi:nuclear transport factor 2 family protein [Novosphingobium beihaiensis]|uniref:Nuclear transport factor 2 family protein n=1 Tax=Novosphingobium beihaiensis TaxID=2930389 RepID=A0ABT0BVA8_9SPHN|nr:nuclear transport factor 2 family protein [Novosphingobium beihaiensis]MCJ2188947.1 nuclear transport factor 2 family protein [Novosphingobium beihaiensis]
MKIRSSTMALAAFSGILVSPIARAEPQAHPDPKDQSTAKDQVLAAEKAYWKTFNACDLDTMGHFLTQDVEFYHDKSGKNATRAKVIASMRDGPCNPAASTHMRREPVARTGQVFLLAGGYALTRGEHRFLTTGPDKIERHDSIARYTVLWRKTGAGWQIARAISYDHRPDLPNLIPVQQPMAQLRAAQGQYQLDDGNILPVTLKDGKLTLGTGERAMELVPLGKGLFGTEGRWLQFRIANGLLEIMDEGKLAASGKRLSN